MLRPHSSFTFEYTDTSITLTRPDYWHISHSLSTGYVSLKYIYMKAFILQDIPTNRQCCHQRLNYPYTYLTSFATAESLQTTAGHDWTLAEFVCSWFIHSLFIADILIYTIDYYELISIMHVPIFNFTYFVIPYNFIFQTSKMFIDISMKIMLLYNN